MSEILKLAEAYYKVAANMEYHARRQLEIASELNRHADRLCEQNMRESKSPPQQKEQP